MGFFDKIVKTAKKAGNSIQRKASNTARRAVHEVSDFAEDVVDTAENAAHTVGSGIENTVKEAMKQGEKLIDKIDVKRRLIAETEEWINDNKSHLLELLNQMQAIKDSGEFTSKLAGLKRSAKQRKMNRNTQSELAAISGSANFREANQTAKKLGDYQSWSIQFGVEGGIGLVGAGGALGYAGLINPGNDPDAHKGIFSGGVNFGTFGASGGLYLGWWHQEPKDLSGASFSLGGGFGFGPAAAFTRYASFDNKWLGFVIELGAGVDAEIGVTIEGTQVFG